MQATSSRLREDKDRLALAAKIFPAKRSAQIGARRRFGHQHGLHLVILRTPATA